MYLGLVLFSGSAWYYRRLLPWPFWTKWNATEVCPPIDARLALLAARCYGARITLELWCRPWCYLRALNYCSAHVT